MSNNDGPSIHVSPGGCFLIIFTVCLIIFLQSHGGTIAEKLVNGVCT